MSAAYIPLAALSEDRRNAVDLAADVADHIAAQSLEFARDVFRASDSLSADVLILASAHAQAAATVYAAHELTMVIREAVPELAGAISEAGTDIGAGIAEGLTVAMQVRSCQSDT